MYETPRYKDEAEENRQLEARQKQMQEYRMFRERVEKWREDDRMDRNRTKIQQLEECERLQVTQDWNRNYPPPVHEGIRREYDN